MADLEPREGASPEPIAHIRVTDDTARTPFSRRRGGWGRMLAARNLDDVPNSILMNVVWTILAFISAAASVSALAVQLLRWRGDVRGRPGAATATHVASRHEEIR